MAFLNDLRMEQAKRLLLQSGEPVRSVAQTVGYGDEFYFSRKFKSATGYSPTAYVKKMKRPSKIASLNHLVTGHLIALGLEPYAAIKNHAFPLTGHLEHTIEVGRSNPDLEKLATAKPDLIIRRSSRLAEGLSRLEDLFAQIAPTLSLPYGESWRTHFRTIARHIGREREAEEWLERYDSKAEAVQKRIKSRVGGETFLILGVGGKGFGIYGQRNVGAVLYGDLKLQVPEGAAQVEHYRQIALDELWSLDADRILLTVFKIGDEMPAEQAIRKQLQRLKASRQWNSLKAVRLGKVYSMHDNSHLYTSYNAYSHDLLLRKMEQLLLPDGN